MRILIVYVFWLFGLNLGIQAEPILVQSITELNEAFKIAEPGDEILKASLSSVIL